MEFDVNESDDLPIEKLRLEVRELNRPFWQRNLAAIATLIFAVGTVLYGTCSGYFSASKERIEADVRLLRLEWDSLNKAKDSLRIVNDSLSSTLDSLAEAYHQMTARYTQRDDQIRKQDSALTFTKSVLAQERVLNNAQVKALNDSLVAARMNGALVASLQRQIDSLTARRSSIALAEEFLNRPRIGMFDPSPSAVLDSARHFRILGQGFGVMPGMVCFQTKITVFVASGDPRSRGIRAIGGRRKSGLGGRTTQVLSQCIEGLAIVYWSDTLVQIEVPQESAESFKGKIEKEQSLTIRDKDVADTLEIVEAHLFRADGTISNEIK